MVGEKGGGEGGTYWHEYCSSQWSSPVDQSRYFQQQYGTSMMRGGTNNLLSVGRGWY